MLIDDRVRSVRDEVVELRTELRGAELEVVPADLGASATALVVADPAGARAGALMIGARRLDVWPNVFVARAWWRCWRWQKRWVDISLSDCSSSVRSMAAVEIVMRSVAEDCDGTGELQAVSA